MVAVPLPRVRIVSPALAAANNGNWHTAARWRGFLAPIATVDVTDSLAPGDDLDLLIALHARRSAAVISAARAQRPSLPIVVVLTGTDLYRDLDVDAAAKHSLECASRIVVLQEAALARLDVASRAKAQVIVQSASALRALHTPGDAELVAVGHLRDEKDPETLDARGAPARRRPGAADDRPRRRGARPAPRRTGARDHGRSAPPTAGSARCRMRAARRTIAAARALVHTSRMEGGANVVIEAVRSGVPVLASRIDGNVGLLGLDYDGYFASGDAGALAALVQRFRADAAFAAALAGPVRRARAALSSGRRAARACAPWSPTSSRHDRRRADRIGATTLIGPA